MIDYQPFMEKMREKYSRENVMGETGYKQPYLPVGNQRTGYTGDVPKNQVAGAVHGGEQVIEEPMVRAAGGPEKIRETVEEMANGAVQQRIPGFKNGTGSGLVPDRPKTVESTKINVPKPEAIEIEAPRGRIDRTQTITPQGLKTTFDTNTTQEGQRAGAAAANASADKNIAATKTAAGIAPQTAARVPQPVQPPPVAAPKPAERDKDVAAGLSGIRDVAAGRSEAQRILEEKAAQRQAGTAAVEDMSLAQKQAQAGTEGGAAAAERANLERQQRISANQENVALAQQGAERQEQAQKALFNAGMEVSKFDEMKRQFGEELDLSKDQFGLTKEKFEEFKRQFETDDAFRKFKYDTLSAAEKEAFRLQGETIQESKERWVHDQQTDALMAAAEAGNFDEVEKIWADRNVTFDATKLRDAFTQEEFGTALGNIETSIAAGSLDQYRTDDGSFDYDKAINSPEFKGQLERAGRQIGLEPGTDEYKEWAKNTVEARQLSRNPYYTAAQVMASDPKVMEEMIKDFGWENPEDFEYAGQKGVKAGILATTAMLAFQSLSLDENDDATMTDNSTLKKIFSNPQKKEEGLKLTGDVSRDSVIKINNLSSKIGKLDVPETKSGKSGFLSENKEVSDIIKSLSQEEWRSVLEDENNMKTIRNVIPEINRSDDLWTLSSLKEMNLKPDEAFNITSFEGKKSSTTTLSNTEKGKDFIAGKGNGSIVLYDGVPYRLTSATTEIHNDKRGNYDWRETVIKGIPLTGGDEAEIIRSDKTDRRGSV